MKSQPIQIRSSSSTTSVTLLERATYNAQLLALRIKGADPSEIATGLLAEVRRTAELYERNTGRCAGDARVLEIGFGARPYRAMAMATVFGSVLAIDLDEPAFRLSQIPAVWRRNGPERAIKTAVRLALFDLRERNAVRRKLEDLSGTGKSATPVLRQADAADAAFWAGEGPFDLIVSDDVFEHIPGENLPQVLTLMRQGLHPSGLAVIRPFVFNGISGGHDIEAYPSNLDDLSPSRAWRHVWDPSFRVNTYLNRLSRKAFKDLFAAQFAVITDVSLMPSLGRDLLSDELRSKMAALDEYELFSNKVEFVLSPKHP